MASPSPPVPSLAFVSAARTTARVVRARLEKRYGAVKPAQADIIVALGGDGLMLQTLHRNMRRRTPIYGMNLGTVGFLMNTYREAGLLQRLKKARQVALTPLRMRALNSRGQIFEATAINEVSLLRSSRQTARIAVSVDGMKRLPDLYCDGALVATPAGSTAYNLSAHVPILPLHARLLSLTPVTVLRFVSNWLSMPRAWMLGACVFSTVAAFAGLRIGMRVRLRQGMIIVMGVLLGSGFTPELVQQLGKWAISLCVLSGMTMTGATLGYLWFRRFTTWYRVTCYFAAMPGGLNDMTIMGGAMGGQERAIALAHALRILTVVLTIPLWYRLLNGAQTSVLTMVHGPTNNDWKDYAVLIACGLIGAVVGRLPRRPASFMMGPILISAIAHLAGLTNSKPP